MIQQNRRLNHLRCGCIRYLGASVNIFINMVTGKECLVGLMIHFTRMAEGSRFLRWIHAVRHITPGSVAIDDLPDRNLEILCRCASVQDVSGFNSECLRKLGDGKPVIGKQFWISVNILQMNQRAMLRENGQLLHGSSAGADDLDSARSSVHHQAFYCRYNGNRPLSRTILWS